jgi:hypothetical protein
MAVAEPAHGPEVAGRVGDHPGGALDERLEDNGGDLLLAHGQQPRHRIDVAGRRVVGLEEQRAEGRVEERHPADGDRTDRVAVVRILETDERGLPHVLPAAVLLVLERHLERDLDGSRSGVRVEDAVETVGSDLDQPPGQLGRAGVREPEHRRVGNPVELLPQRLVDRRMAMAVDVAPQGGDAVQIAAPVRVDQLGPLR